MNLPSAADREPGLGRSSSPRGRPGDGQTGAAMSRPAIATAPYCKRLDKSRVVQEQHVPALSKHGPLILKSPGQVLEVSACST